MAGHAHDRGDSRDQSHRKDGFHFITQAMEAGGWLYCSSLESQTLARMPIHAID